jgi:L-ascorbate metabolism protein UlaG (beta-lactamase superfamily)
MKITYYGHSAVGVEVAGKHLLFDPFITPNEKAKHLNIEEIPADYILISHGHEDHVADVAAIAQRTGAQLISNFEIITWFGKQGISNGHPMNHGGRWSFDFGTVQYVNAVHSSALPDGSNGGNPGGFIVHTDEGNFYFSGDTALTYDMKLFGEQNKLDFAFLCMGDNFTMGVVDAAMAADFIQCDQIMGIHYDTFGYIVIDHEAAKQLFSSKGKTLYLPAIGESIEV